MAGRFSTLLDQLSRSVPPLSLEDAARVADVGDAYMGTGESDAGSRWSGDVGANYQSSSSFGRKGRLLAATVRYMRPESCLELGTGYGMSALYILGALRKLGRGSLTTVESSTSRATLSKRMLDAEFGAMVTLEQAQTSEVLARRVEPVQFLFHDAAHNADAYVNDFHAALHLLPSGATVVFDDIQWEDRRAPTDNSGTYEGWSRIARHERVRCAAEIEGIGVVLLS